MAFPRRQFAKNVSISQENQPRCCHSIYSLFLSDQLQREYFDDIADTARALASKFPIRADTVFHNDGLNCDK